VAYRKFSDAIREDPICPEPEPTRPLAGLATLAGIRAEDRISPKSDEERPAGSPSPAGDTIGIGGSTPAVAKVAKVAKDAGSAVEDGTSQVDPSEVIRQDGCKPPLPEPRLIAPAPWFERRAPSVPGEPPYDQPCPARRGRDERKGTTFLHFCVICGAWGSFGYGVLGDRPGRWYCREHRPKD
jgi:hypothetical protein